MWDIIFELDLKNSIKFVSTLSVVVLFISFMLGFSIKKLIQLAVKA